MENFLLKIFHAWRRKIPVGRAPTAVQKDLPSTFTRSTIATRLVAGRRTTQHALGGFQTGGGRD